MKEFELDPKDREKIKAVLAHAREKQNWCDDARRIPMLSEDHAVRVGEIEARFAILDRPPATRRAILVLTGVADFKMIPLQVVELIRVFELNDAQVLDGGSTLYLFEELPLPQELN